MATKQVLFVDEGLGLISPSSRAMVQPVMAWETTPEGKRSPSNRQELFAGAPLWSLQVDATEVRFGRLEVTNIELRMISPTAPTVADFMTTALGGGVRA